MHPPDFGLQQMLSDWPDCHLEVNCGCTGRMATIPVRLMLRERGDRPFGTIVAGLRCKACGGKPAPVYLVAGLTRQACGGPPSAWSVELVPVP